MNIRSNQQIRVLSTQPDPATLAGFVNTVEAVIGDQLIAIPFALGALMFYVLLYQSRLVPRWLSVWGLLGAVLYILPPLGSMFGISLGVLMAPLAVQEMVMAVWLIAKGFSSRSELRRNPFRALVVGGPCSTALPFRDTHTREAST
jgi:hypothetical protein